MASNFFARYIWLVDVIKRHRQGITFKRINEPLEAERIELWRNGRTASKDISQSYCCYHGHVRHRY